MNRIVIADDHPLLRAAVRRHLLATGTIEVVGEAQDGVEALQLVERLQPDVVIVDLSMPRKDGLAVTRALNSWGRPPKVVVLTAYVSLFFALRCYRAGAHGFVGKTEPPGELINAIDAAMRGRRYVPPTLLEDVASHLLERPGDSDPMESLTARELEVLRLIAGGSTNREIGGELGISVRTVDTHRSNLLKKLGLRNNADLTRVAVAFGVIPT